MLADMRCQGSQRDSWLRLIPEPERLLPAAVAALRIGSPTPTSTAVEFEMDHMERLILHGDGVAWLRYLDSAVELASRPVGEELSSDALLVAEVVRDHHRLLIGVSPSLAHRSRAAQGAAEMLVLRLRQEASGPVRSTSRSAS